MEAMEHQQPQHHQHQHQQPPGQPRLPRELVPIAPLPSSTEVALSPVIVNYVQEQLSLHRATLKRDIDEFRQEMLMEMSKRQKTAESRGLSRQSAAAANALAQQHMNASLAGVSTITEGMGKGDGGAGLLPQGSRSGGSLLVEGGGEGGMEEALGGALDSSQGSAVASLAAERADKYKDVPSYELSLEVKTVRDLFQEWYDGWKGGPSVKVLNEKYETRWRKTDKARQRWCRRESVYRELMKRAREASERKSKRPPNTTSYAELTREDYEEAVVELDGIMMRMSYSLNKLAEWLKKPAKPHVQLPPPPPPPPQQQPQEVALPLSLAHQQLGGLTSHGGLTHAQASGMAEASAQPQMLTNPEALGVSVRLPSPADNAALGQPPTETPLLHPPSPIAAPTTDQAPAPTMGRVEDQLPNAGVTVLPPLHHNHHHHLEVSAES